MKQEEKFKKETIEEAAESYAELSYYNRDEVNAFVNGAKWQAKRMYSEDEVIILLNKIGASVYGNYTRNETMEDFVEEWFEQFKKK
jgi:hypothetical protein